MDVIFLLWYLIIYIFICKFPAYFIALDKMFLPHYFKQYSHDVEEIACVQFDMRGSTHV